MNRFTKHIYKIDLILIRVHSFITYTVQSNDNAPAVEKPIDDARNEAATHIQKGTSLDDDETELTEEETNLDDWNHH